MKRIELQVDIPDETYNYLMKMPGSTIGIFIRGAIEQRIRNIAKMEDSIKKGVQYRMWKSKKGRR
jgi:hypothetical protein